MTTEEFKEWVFNNTEYSVQDVADIDRKDNSLVIDIESIKGIAEAYHKAKVESVTDEMIEGEMWIEEDKLDIEHNQGFERGVKWFKKQLLKK